jgi:maltooligosyltrehalose trehalohydrolase
MRFGAEVTPAGTRFKLWAPKCKTVRLRIKGRRKLLKLEAREEGWHRLEVDGIQAGALYKFVLPDDTEIADPCSRFQPGDVDGYSEVIDPGSFGWTDRLWTGRPWAEAILYEIHVGTFTQDGTFSAVADRLDHLVELGVTAIQLMPLADWYGGFNWGYDGVMQFAPSSSYGRPEDLKALIDAAHARSIMVIVDVVYNHFGAVGNALPLIAPIFTNAHESPWGDAINYDGKGAEVVRELIVESALTWMAEYHLDGLRFDAVHAITDDSNTHILELLAARILAANRHRHVHLIVENSENQERWLKRDTAGEPVHFTAQWNDDFHHLVHSAATGENTGYYADFDNRRGRFDMLGRALAEGFAYQGEFKPQEGVNRGQSSVGLPPTAFVSYMQNHDQVGNRIKGNRICTLVSEDVALALASVYLLSPQIPMLFMGEEWGAKEPFPFFSDLPENLRDVTRQGRIEELKKTPEHEDPDKPNVEEAVDPTAVATFRSAKMDWSALEGEGERKRLQFYQTLLDLRSKEIVPRLIDAGGFKSSHEVLGDNSVLVTWVLGDGAKLRLYLNLCAETQLDVPPILGRQIWQQGFLSEGRLGPWTVLWTIEVG